MNHRRGRRKKARAGCLMCKPHKMNGVKKRKFTKISGMARAWKQEARAQLSEEEQSRTLCDLCGGTGGGSPCNDPECDLCSPYPKDRVPCEACGGVGY